MAKSHPAALTTRKYGAKKAELLKACLSREFVLMNRNSFVYIFKFIQYLLLLLLNQMASALFRFIAAIGRGDLILANTFGSFALVMLFALGGFVLLREAR
ncbi:pleiotropic drug resistance protein tur2 [Quercus suber]|uniref:Pleiotropic drug resistance protein tur2 n=1 Tax=Quercus suber TaxID=58331 RepID=A0AAW0KLC7_QUESU